MSKSNILEPINEEPLSEFTEEEPKKCRKQYSKKYYNDNKKELLSKMLVKEKCKYCDRNVAHQQMQKHQCTAYCKKRRFQTLDRLTDIRDHFKEKGIETENLEYIIKHAFD